MDNKEKSFSFSEKYVTGEAYYGFWNLTSRIFGTLNTFLIISSLTVYQYGVFQLILSLYNTASDSISFGGSVVENDLVRSVSEGNELRAKRLFFEFNGLRLAVAFLFFLIVFLGADILFPNYGKDFLSEVRVISFLFLAEVLYTSVKTLLNIRMDFKALASRTAFYKFVQLGALAVFFFFKSIGLREVILSMVISSILTSVSLLRRAVRDNGKWFGIGMGKGSEMRKVFSTYGAWEIIRQLFSKISGRVPPWIIKFFVGTEAVAIFSVADTMVGTLKNIIPTNTLSSLIPRVVGDKERSQRIFDYGVKTMFALSLFVVAGSYLLVPIFVNAIFPSYKNSLPLFYVMMLGAPLSAAGSIATFFVIALRKQKFLFLHTTFKNVTKIILDLILVPLLGIYGMALENVFITVITFSIIFYYIWKIRPGGIVLSRKTFLFDKEEDWPMFKLIVKNSLFGLSEKIKK